jgi:hypothetical protein
MLTTLPPHDSSSPIPRSSEGSLSCTPHPLDQLVLHLLPGRPPGLMQQELMDRIHQAMHMNQVRAPVVSAVLARLEQTEQIASCGEGRARRYWRLGPAPRPPKQEGSTPGSTGETLR